jgi:hypothetical protein
MKIKYDFSRQLNQITNLLKTDHNKGIVELKTPYWFKNFLQTHYRKNHNFPLTSRKIFLQANFLLNQLFFLFLYQLVDFFSNVYLWISQKLGKKTVKLYKKIIIKKLLGHIKLIKQQCASWHRKLIIKFALEEAPSYFLIDGKPRRKKRVNDAVRELMNIKIKDERRWLLRLYSFTSFFRFLIKPLFFWIMYYFQFFFIYTFFTLVSMWLRYFYSFSGIFKIVSSLKKSLVWFYTIDEFNFKLTKKKCYQFVKFFVFPLELTRKHFKLDWLFYQVKPTDLNFLRKIWVRRYSIFYRHFQSWRPTWALMKYGRKFRVRPRLKWFFRRQIFKQYVHLKRWYIFLNNEYCQIM